MLLSDDCLSRTSGPTREQRPRKTKIGAEVAHVTRHADTTFKVKRSRSPGRFTQHGLNAAAAVSVGTYSAWESTATLRLLGGARRGRRGAGVPYIVLPRAQFVCFSFISNVSKGRFDKQQANCSSVLSFPSPFIRS